MTVILDVLDKVVWFIVLAIVGRALLSWFVRDPTGNPLMKLLIDVTEPILSPIRRVLPQTMMIDLSPLIAIIAIQVIWQIVHQLAISGLG